MSQDPSDGARGHAGGQHGHGPVGPLVDEAALLLTAVEDKLQAWQTTQGHMADVDVDVALPRPCPECGTVPGAACTGCPVCRLVAAVRGERPEVTARMVDGALTIVRALRTLLPEPAAEPTRSPAADGPIPRGTPDGPSDDDPGDSPVAWARAGSGFEPADDSAESGPTLERDVGRRPGAPTPPRPAPRPSRPAGLQRIDIS